nr:N-acetyltransferase [Plesiomonas shigelloides]
MLIRIAQPSDAEQLAILAERTFRDTFASSNTQEDMELHCQSNYSKEHQLKEIQNPNWITLVCECENMLAGYAQMRWEEFPSCVEAKTPREILCFYVDKPWHGHGIAQEMMKACLAELKKRNTDVVWLGVWEHNPRAIAFYKKFDFVEVGEHIFQLGADAQRDIIMMRYI